MMEFTAKKAFALVAGPVVTAAVVAALVAAAALAATPANAAEPKASSLVDNMTATFTASGGFRYKDCKEAQDAMNSWKQGSLVASTAAKGEVTLKAQNGKTCKLDLNAAPKQ